MKKKKKRTGSFRFDGDFEVGLEKVISVYVHNYSRAQQDEAWLFRKERRNEGRKEGSNTAPHQCVLAATAVAASVACKQKKRQAERRKKKSVVEKGFIYNWLVESQVKRAALLLLLLL